MITRIIKNKIDATPIFSKNRTFKRREFNFVNIFKRYFEAKYLKDFLRFLIKREE